MWRRQGKAPVKIYRSSHYVCLQSHSEGLLREEREQLPPVLNLIFPRVWLLTIILSIFYWLFHACDLVVFLDHLLITVPLRMISFSLPTFSLKLDRFLNSVVLQSLVQPVRTILSATACGRSREMHHWLREEAFEFSFSKLTISKITQGRAQREGLVESQQGCQKPLDEISVWKQELKQ